MKHVLRMNEQYSPSQNIFKRSGMIKHSYGCLFQYFYSHRAAYKHGNFLRSCHEEEG